MIKSATQGKNLMTEKFLPHGNFFENGSVIRIPVVKDRKLVGPCTSLQKDCESADCTQ